MSGLEGATLDHYQIQRLLGHGGMADVYLAYDSTTRQDVAIKVMIGSQAAYLERFRREAEAIDKLQHEHILPAYDYGDQEPWHYLVMPYIPAGTLRERLEAGPLPLQNAADLLDQIASALQFAHDHGIIHRDIKPSNILLRDNTYIFLADFGLAKPVEGTNDLTQTGIMLGTPEYMAPDLANGPASKSSDIYALGILLYEMVTGRVPFRADTPVAVYWKQIREKPLPPSQINPQLSDAIDRVILRALDKNPGRRYQSALELAQAFRAAVVTPNISSDRNDFSPYRNVQRETDVPPHARPFTTTRKQEPGMMPHNKLILPGDVRAEPRVVGSRDKWEQTLPAPAGEMPPLPLRPQNVETQEPHSSPAIVERRTVPPEQRRKLNKLATAVIGLGLALFIVLPMTYIYYIYRTHNGQASMNSTSLVSSGITATQPGRRTQPPTPTPHSTVSPVEAAENTVLNSHPLLVDSLTSNTLNRWTVDEVHCTFGNGGYEVNNTQMNYLQACPMLNPTVSNSAVEVDVSMLGGTSADLLFRFNGAQYYDFAITSSNQFSFARHDANTASSSSYSYLIKNTYSGAILAMGQKNTLLIIANGADFKLYINGTFVGEAQDATYSNGQVALASGTSSLVTTGQAIFSNLKVFKLA